MKQRPFFTPASYKASIAIALLLTALSVQAASVEPELSTTDQNNTEQSESTPPSTNATVATDISNTLAAQMQPSTQALSEANQELLSRNAQLQRQVNDLQTQANVLIYESRGQLFLYGAFTVLISLLVGIFISWLVFVRRERW